MSKTMIFHIVPRGHVLKCPKGPTGVGLQGPLGLRDRPTGDRVLGGQGVGLQCPRESRGRLTGSQEVKGYA